MPEIAQSSFICEAGNKVRTACGSGRFASVAKNPPATAGGSDLLL